MKEPHKDDLDAVASAAECTGAVPAMPWDADTEESRKLLKIHRQLRPFTAGLRIDEWWRKE